MKKNNISLISGNLGADPERIATKSGIMITTFNIAVNTGHFDKDENKYINTRTNWIPITAFDHLGSVAHATLKKGDQITVIGEIKTTSYVDKTEIKRTGFEIIASDIKKSSFLIKENSDVSEFDKFRSDCITKNGVDFV